MMQSGLSYMLCLLFYQARKDPVLVEIEPDTDLVFDAYLHILYDTLCSLNRYVVQ